LSVCRQAVLLPIFPATEKVTSIFKKFKKVACHQFVALLGYEAAGVLKKTTNPQREY
jgi:hypothetical protein